MHYYYYDTLYFFASSFVLFHVICFIRSLLTRLDSYTYTEGIGLEPGSCTTAVELEVCWERESSDDARGLP